MVNPDTIPRYQEPSGEQLSRMFDDPTPAEVMGRCLHHRACRMVLGMFVTEHPTDKRSSELLQCDVCDEWEPL